MAEVNVKEAAELNRRGEHAAFDPFELGRGLLASWGIRVQLSTSRHVQS